MGDPGLYNLLHLAQIADEDSYDEPKKRKGPSYEPVLEEAKLAELRTQGLTKRGEKKVSVGDLRCRPPKYHREELFAKTLPQFRLATVIDAAHGEDLVMLWAYLTGREAKLRTREFRFDPDTYLKDHELIADLKKIGNSDDELEIYIKERYGTVRQPKRQRTQGPSPLALPSGGAEPHNLGDMTRFHPGAGMERLSAGKVESRTENAIPGSQVSRSAEYYIKEFEKYPGEKTERQLQSMSEKERRAYHKEKAAHEKQMAGKRQETVLRALHKAAW